MLGKEIYQLSRQKTNNQNITLSRGGQIAPDFSRVGVYRTERTTFVDVVFPPQATGLKTRCWLRKIALILGFSIFTAISAKIRIYLPFTPVPITGQTLAVLLTGTSLGSQMATLSIAIYLLAGVVGIPVFSGKSAGVTYLFGSTGGYLIGFLIAVYVVGRLAERGTDRSLKSCFPAMLLGNLIIYAFGLAWLARFVPMNKLLAVGLIPFILGDLVKLALASVIMPICWNLKGEK